MVYLFRIDFTVVILLNVWASLSGGLLSPISQAFSAFLSALTDDLETQRGDNQNSMRFQ
jgi:hypothetical protein